MNVFVATLRTPFGRFLYAMNPAGAVVATAFGDETALRQRLKSPYTVIDAPPAEPGIRAQLEEYFAGRRPVFSLALAPAGTPFQIAVWTELQRIPYGKTRSYGEVAAALGRPAAARAVGRANATNSICVIVPCHRVIGANGALTGFAFGEKIKRGLLALEAAADR